MNRSLGFIKWIFKKFGPFEYSWFIFIGCLSAGLTSGEGTQRHFLWGISVTIFAFWFIKWSLWDGTRSLWAEFNKEQKTVVDLLKKDYK